MKGSLFFLIWSIAELQYISLRCTTENVIQYSLLVNLIYMSGNLKHRKRKGKNVAQKVSYWNQARSLKQRRLSWGRQPALHLILWLFIWDSQLWMPLWNGCLSHQGSNQTLALQNSGKIVKICIYSKLENANQKQEISPILSVRIGTIQKKEGWRNRRKEREGVEKKITTVGEGGEVEYYYQKLLWKTVGWFPK